MIRRLLSRLNDIRDARTLARTVRVQDEQIDALTVLNEHLEASLEVAETAAEEYRARLAEVTVPRDAATLENRVLSLCQGWAADRERDTAARLTAAEVELARLTAAERACHEALSAAGVPFLRGVTVEGRIGFLVGQRRHAEQGWSQASVNGAGVVRRLTEALDARDEAQDRARRWERHARALARAARWMRSALLDCDDVTLSDLRAMSRGAKARLVRIEADRDTRDDAPPPTQPSERRAAAPPSPPRFRTAVVGGDR